MQTVHSILRVETAYNVRPVEAAYVETAYNVRPATTCPFAYGHLPLLLPPQNTHNQLPGLPCVTSIYTPNIFLTVTWHSSHTYSEIWLGGRRGSDFKFLEHSCPPVSLPSYLTWQGYSDTATARSTDKGGHSESMV